MRLSNIAGYVNELLTTHYSLICNILKSEMDFWAFIDILHAILNEVDFSIFKDYSVGKGNVDFLYTTYST